MAPQAQPQARPGLAKFCLKLHNTQEKQDAGAERMVDINFDLITPDDSPETVVKEMVDMQLIHMLDSGEVCKAMVALLVGRLPSPCPSPCPSLPAVAMLHAACCYSCSAQNAVLAIIYNPCVVLV